MDHGQIRPLVHTATLTQTRHASHMRCLGLIDSDAAACYRAYSGAAARLLAQSASAAGCAAVLHTVVRSNLRSRVAGGVGCLARKMPVRRLRPSARFLHGVHSVLIPGCQEFFRHGDHPMSNSPSWPSPASAFSCATVVTCGTTTHETGGEHATMQEILKGSLAARAALPHCPHD